MVMMMMSNQACAGAETEGIESVIQKLKGILQLCCCGIGRAAKMADKQSKTMAVKRMKGLKRVNLHHH